MKLGGWSARSTFFLAMAGQLGQLDQAKKLYEDADRWMRDHQSDDAELERIREEAAAVLYMKSLDAAKPLPKKDQRGTGFERRKRSGSDVCDHESTPAGCCGPSIGTDGDALDSRACESAHQRRPARRPSRRPQAQAARASPRALTSG